MDLICHIEGIYISEARLMELVKEKTEPRNRNEQEIAGYRDEQDCTAAAKWYRKSDEQGYFRAQISLGGCYVTGRGVAKDSAAAV